MHHKNYNGQVLDYPTCDHLLRISTNWTEWNDVWRMCIHKFWQLHFTVKIVAEPIRSTRTNFRSAFTFIPLFSVCDELVKLSQDHGWTLLIRSKSLHHCQYDWSMISTLKMEFNAPPNRWCPPRKQYNQNMHGYKSRKKTRNQNLLLILRGQRCYHLQADDVCNFRWI